MTENTKIYWLRGVELAKRLQINVREVYKRFERGELEDNGKSGMKRRFKFLTQNDSEVLAPYDLKEKHLEVKIKKEEQLLYENKLLLAEKVADAFINIYHLPRILTLTEVVRKHGTEELITAWNKQAEIGATENLRELQEEFQRLALN